MANDSNCSYPSDEDLDHLSLARGVAGIVAFLGCCLTLLLILLHRAFRSTLQRLFLYLPVALTVHIAVNIMQISSSHEGYCKTVGFLNQYTLHVVLFFMLGAILYLSHRVRKSSPNRRKNTKPTESKRKRIYGEVAFVVFSVIFPLTYNLIPFATDAYGGQPWCWMKIYVKDCSTDSSIFPIVLILGFLPPIIILTLCVSLLVSIMIAYSWWAFTFRSSKEIQNTLARKAYKPLLLVVIVLSYLVYTCIFLIASIHLYAEGEDRDLYRDYPFGLLVVNAVFLPLVQMVLPVSFVLYLYSFKRDVRKAKEVWVSYFKTFSVTKEESGNASVVIHDQDQEETFHRSAYIDVPSTTCYPLPHEFSDEFISSPPLSSPSLAVGPSQSANVTRTAGTM